MNFKKAVAKKLLELLHTPAPPEPVSLISTVGDGVAHANTVLNRLLTASPDAQIPRDEISRVANAIEEIAFQTNLLALNSALKVSRPDPAGLNISTLTDDVRNLAQRCTNAAKESTALRGHHAFN